MTTFRQSIGRWGENLAAEYLAAKGYAITGRNVRTPYGEIDLIATLPGSSNESIIFIEVKTRTSEAFGLPEDAINARKREHLVNACQFYIQQHPEIKGDWRIDVIAIQRSRLKPTPVITHFENAIT